MVMISVCISENTDYFNCLYDEAQIADVGKTKCHSEIYTGCTKHNSLRCDILLQNYVPDAPSGKLFI